MEDEDDDIDVRALPIFRKGKEILEVVCKLAELIPKENSMLMETRGQMIVDAAQLSVKVAGAEAGDLYDIRMECAAVIRKAARDLMVQKHALKMFGFEEAEYFQVVRDLLEEYRLLFIDWVAGFDKENYIIDRWGLFNPLGVGPFDKDPDDDIPFDPSSFFEGIDD